MTCAACSIAERNPETGQLVDACRGCAVRLASKAPREIRLRLVQEWREKHGQAAGDQFGLDVVDEFNRRQAWKRVA